MSIQATFGLLNEKAAIGADRAITRTATMPLGSQSVAAAWMGGYLRTLRAIETQMWTIRNAISPTSWFTSPPRSSSSLEIDEVFNALTKRVRGATEVRMIQEDMHATMWDPVVTALDAGSDLIRTHFSNLLPRTFEVESVLEDRSGRLAALTSASDLMATVLSGRDQLALRAAQTGFNWSQLDEALPTQTAVLAAARTAVAHESHILPPEWDGLTVANVPIRSDDPATEFAGRLHRVRQFAWATSRQAQPSVSDVRHLATVNLELHVALLLDQDGVSPEGRESVVNQAKGWQQVHRVLQNARGTEPANKVLLGDHERIVQLMREASPVTGSDRRKLVAQAVTHSPEIARELRTTIDVLARQDAIYIPYVPGEVPLGSRELSTVNRGGMVKMKTGAKQTVWDGLEAAAGVQTTQTTRSAEKTASLHHVHRDQDINGIDMG